MGYKSKHNLRRFAVGASALTMLFTAPAAFAADDTATGRVITLRPLSIVNVSDLDFGSIIPGAAGGTVLVNATTGARSTSGSVIAAGSTSSSAQFLTYGGPLQFISITRGPLPVLTRAGGTETMNVNFLTLNGATFRFLNAAGLLDLRVGGQLTVGANQTPGLYSGNFDITVTYF